MEQYFKNLLGKMAKTALLSVFLHFGFLGGVCRASEIYIEKSIWNDDQSVYEDIDGTVMNNDSDWYLKGCNTIYLGNHYNGTSGYHPRLSLVNLTLHAELGERNLSEAVLSFNFFGQYTVLMEWQEIKWDITASADLKPGRYLLFTTTKSTVVSVLHVVNWKNPHVEAEEYGNGMVSIYYNHLGSQVPEPGAAGLSLLGITAALWRRRRE